MSNKVVVIHARDHFSTDNHDEDNCIVQFVGVIIEENEIYVTIRYIKADILKKNSGEEVHKIVKSAIIDRQEFQFTHFQGTWPVSPKDE